MLILFKRFTLVLVLLFLVAGCSKSSEPEPMPATSAPSTTYVSPSLAPEYYEAMEITTQILELEKKYLFTNENPRPPFPEEEFTKYMTVDEVAYMKEEYEYYGDMGATFNGVDVTSYLMRPTTAVKRENSLAQILVCIDASNQTVTWPDGTTTEGGQIQRTYFFDTREGNLKTFGSTDEVRDICEI